MCIGVSTHSSKTPSPTFLPSHLLKLQTFQAPPFLAIPSYILVFREPPPPPHHTHTHRAFPTGGDGGSVPTTRKFAHSSPHWKNSLHSRLPPSPHTPNFYFSSHQRLTPPPPPRFNFIVLGKNYANFLILIDVQYSQKAFFSFEKGWNSQNHSSSGSHLLIKKFPLPSKISEFPHPPLTTICKTLSPKN